MSEFRIFCIVAFVAGGLLCAAINHKVITEPKDGAAGILMLSLALAFGVVALFGRRSA